MTDVTALRAGDPEGLAGYRLVRRLGEGGQGTVYLGLARGGEKVAVKVLHARLAGDAGGRERFLREIEAARRVARFSTAQILDADVDGERPFVVSEYVEGPSLQRLVAEQGPRTGGALERLAVGTATALQAIHRAGVVHRDFKPGNVLLGPDGPRVIDFGIARALEATATTGRAAGTPSYMAPEQLGRGPVGPAADVFAWGATMAYAATGNAVFGEDSVAAVIGRVLRSEPDLSGVPEPLRAVVADCLAKDPAARPTAREVLDRMLGTETAPAADTAVPLGEAVPEPAPEPVTVPLNAPAPEPPPEPAKKPRPRWLLPAAAAVALAVAAAVCLLVLLPGGGKPKPFTTLDQGACDMLSSATARRLVPDGKADTSANEVKDTGPTRTTGCEWTGPQHTSAWRDLGADITLEVDVPSVVAEPPKGLDRAAKDLRDDRRQDSANANRTHRTSGEGPAFTDYYGPLVEEHGLGDEAYAFSQHRHMDDDPSFEPTEETVTARLRNAVVRVTYVSGDMQDAKHMVPTPEPTARKRAESALRELLDHLADCKPCTK